VQDILPSSAKLNHIIPNPSFWYMCFDKNSWNPSKSNEYVVLVLYGQEISLNDAERLMVSRFIVIVFDLPTKEIA
jgi:hypothetical protein